MPGPDYLICVECETPLYVFEWRSDKLIEAICETCGNDDVDQFLTEEDFEALQRPDLSGPGVGTGRH